MTTPDAEDASPSPEYRSDLEDDDDDMAAEQSTDRQNGEGSPSQKTTNGKPNAKDPLRPRRKKARRACFACQRAHLTCGEFNLVPTMLFPTMSFQSEMVASRH
jgi:hypothetical protein